MKKYTDTNIESIYYHDRMGEKKFAAITVFVENYLEKHIKLQDMFNEINSFINYKNNTKDNIFEPETSIMGLSSLLTMAGVKKPLHREVFEDIAYNNFNTEGTARERAIKIHKAWLEKALELRGQEED
jgi:hypothetical protein